MFKELRLLGQGNFSKVFHARNRVDGLEYAVKRSKHEVADEALRRQWLQARPLSPAWLSEPVNQQPCGAGCASKRPARSAC